MTTSNPILSAVAAIALASCSVIAPLEEMDQSPDGTTRGPAKGRGDGSGTGDSSPPARNGAGGTTEEDGVDGGAAEGDVTTPRGDSSRAGRTGGAMRAGNGGSGRAGSGGGGAGAAGAGPADAGPATDAGVATDAAAGGPADTGDPTTTSNEPACDPVSPQQPRPPLTACPAGQACFTHEDDARDGAVPTTCGPAGRTSRGASCARDTDCTAGHFCDTVLRICAQFCDTPNDCDDTAELCVPITPSLTIGTTALTLSGCLESPL